MSKSTTRSHTPSHSNTATDPVTDRATGRWGVVLTYRDVGHERLARTCWDSLSRLLNPNGNTIVTEWKFEMLACRALRAIATAEAREARLIVLATDSADGLPDAVKAWVECCSEAEAAGPAALVVLLSETMGWPGTLCPDFAFLEEQMRRSGRGFFVYTTGRSVEDGAPFCAADAKQIVGDGHMDRGDFSEVVRVLIPTEPGAA